MRLNQLKRRDFKLYKEIKCPNCGKSYYQISGEIRTCCYYPPIIKDGININPDRNISTVTCRCLECNKYFKYKEQCGEIIEVIKGNYGETE